MTIYAILIFKYSSVFLAILEEEIEEEMGHSL